jgi:hypothetical protein
METSMKTLTTPIQNAIDVPRITKFEVVDVRENDTDSPPSIAVTVRALGAGNAQYGDSVILYAYNSLASTCLKPNTSQQGYGDLLQLFGQVVTNAYTTLSTAYNANVANATKRKRCLAVEDLLVGTLLSSDFAAT